MPNYRLLSHFAYVSVMNSLKDNDYLSNEQWLHCILQVNLDSFRESSISAGHVKALYGLAAMDCQANDLCALLSKFPILSSSYLNLTLYSCELAASCHANQDSLVCENLLALHPFPSSLQQKLTVYYPVRKPCTGCQENDISALSTFGGRKHPKL